MRYNGRIELSGELPQAPDSVEARRGFTLIELLVVTECRIHESESEG